MNQQIVGIANNSKVHMARLKDREKALRLRKEGKSYSQIKKMLSVSKGALSNWLGDYPLPLDRIRELRDWNEQRIERFRQTTRRKREDRLRKIYNEEKVRLLPLTKKELLIAGLCLYWGEGTKHTMNSLILVNTNPIMIRFFIRWLKSLGVPKSKLSIGLHLYKDMDPAKETAYWSKILGIPVSQFSPPYIKDNLSKRINHKGGFGRGTYTVGIGSVSLKERTLMGIEAIATHTTHSAGQ